MSGAKPPRDGGDTCAVGGAATAGVGDAGLGAGSGRALNAATRRRIASSGTSLVDPRPSVTFVHGDVMLPRRNQSWIALRSYLRKSTSESRGGAATRIVRRGAS